MGKFKDPPEPIRNIVPTVGRIGYSRFFAEWKGHPLADLAAFRERALQLRPDKPIIYLVGDSSLDNKYWVNSQLPVKVPEVYSHVLDKPTPKPDVAFWLNHFLGSRATAINAAVEETMLRDRDEVLLNHDYFVKDRIRSNDILVVSVGANDVALRPNASTMWNMSQLAWFTPKILIESGYAPSLRYFKKLFGDKIKMYVENIVREQKPKAVIICMIYYPLEAGAGVQPSWADVQLKALGYNRWPGQLQAAIRQMYKQATQEIRIEGTTVIPCALYEVLDGKTPGDYTARVEPNEEGGRKMAMKFEELLRPYLD